MKSLPKLGIALAVATLAREKQLESVPTAEFILYIRSRSSPANIHCFDSQSQYEHWQLAISNCVNKYAF